MEQEPELFALDDVTDGEEDSGGGALVFPELPEPVWRDLYALAEKVRDEQPWKRFMEDDWFGIMDPETSELAVVSILGAGGEVFAVQVFLPEEGIRFWNDILLSGEPDQATMIFDLRMLECEFVSKSDLEREDLELFDRYGVKPQGRRRHNWPKFRSTVPEGVPWPVDEGEARLLMLALCLVPAFGSLDDRQLGGFYQTVNADGMPEIPVFSLADGGDAGDASAWQLGRGFFPLAKPKPLPEVVRDEVWLGRLLSLKPRQGTVWECGSFYLETPVEHDGRLVFPALALALDPAVGPTLPEISTHVRDRAQTLRQVLAASAENAGYLPERLLVASPLASAAFADLAGECGVAVELADSLSMLEPLVGILSEVMSLGLDPEMIENSPELMAEIGAKLGEELGAGFPGLGDLVPLGDAGDAPGSADYREPQSKKRFQLRIDLLGTQPAIWRCITIPSDASFFDLHVAIQDAMGWEDEHLHDFSYAKGKGRKQRVNIVWNPGNSDGFGESREELPELTTRLDEVLGRRRIVHYMYDFGDSWEHKVTLEKIAKGDKVDPLPTLVGGEGACPPEDCGGLPGYYELLECDADSLDIYDPEWVEEVKKAVFDPGAVRFYPARDMIDEHAMRNSF